ncbi:MAG: hypothetical protein ACJA0S_001416, partial [Rickettsiales bacterium]
MIIILFFIIPSIFLITEIFIVSRFLIKKKSSWIRAALYGIMGFILFFAILAYDVSQDMSSSTAAIGYLFVPFIATIFGILGLALGKIHTKILFLRQENKSCKVQIFIAITLIAFI